ncbi:MAG: hypothetical protein DCF32_01395 [Leptolyngbya sp.]|jgi:hypothetical protein|nr:MAG: hypothetical protein DCF32_01395 [Leptolyngbya sp.]
MPVMSISRPKRIVVYVSEAEAKAIKQAAKPTKSASFLRRLGLCPPPVLVTHRDLYSHLSRLNKALADLGERYAATAPSSLLQDLRKLHQSNLEIQRTLTPVIQGEDNYDHQDG